MMRTLRHWAAGLKRHVLVAWFAARDPRTPWLVRGLAMLVAAYALSPIDLIPDFIPVLGYLDDLLLVPLGIALVLRLLPADVKAAARAQADAAAKRPSSAGMAAAIVAVWLLVAGTLVVWAWRAWGPA